MTSTTASNANPAVPPPALDSGLVPGAPVRRFLDLRKHQLLLDALNSTPTNDEFAADTDSDEDDCMPKLIPNTNIPEFTYSPPWDINKALGRVDDADREDGEVDEPMPGLESIEPRQNSPVDKVNEHIAFRVASAFVDAIGAAATGEPVPLADRISPPRNRSGRNSAKPGMQMPSCKPCSYDTSHKNLTFHCDQSAQRAKNRQARRSTPYPTNSSQSTNTSTSSFPDTADAQPSTQTSVDSAAVKKEEQDVKPRTPVQPPKRRANVQPPRAPQHARRLREQEQRKANANRPLHHPHPPTPTPHSYQHAGFQDHVRRAITLRIDAATARLNKLTDAVKLDMPDSLPRQLAQVRDQVWDTSIGNAALEATVERIDEDLTELQNRVEKVEARPRRDAPEPQALQQRLQMEALQEENRALHAAVQHIREDLVEHKRVTEENRREFTLHLATVEADVAIHQDDCEDRAKEQSRTRVDWNRVVENVSQATVGRNVEQLRANLINQHNHLCVLNQRVHEQLTTISNHSAVINTIGYLGDRARSGHLVTNNVTTLVDSMTATIRQVEHFFTEENGRTHAAVQALVWSRRVLPILHTLLEAVGTTPFGMPGLHPDNEAFRRLTATLIGLRTVASPANLKLITAPPSRYEPSTNAPQPSEPEPAPENVWSPVAFGASSSSSSSSAEEDSDSDSEAAADADFELIAPPTAHTA